MRTRNALRERLRAAIENADLVVHYQPQHAAEDGQLVGFEALVRLADGAGGFVSPMDFIPIAEEMHLMGQLGAIVLSSAAKEAMRWPEHLHVAVNLSPQQFEGDVVGIVSDALRASGLSAERLELEITESLFISNPEHVAAQLRSLKDLGVRIAMDDFGTGYSSLSYLWQFPFDKLKVDRSCFARLGDKTAANGRDARVIAVLDTIGAMGRAMNLRITAEGIETSDQHAYARQAGYDEVQGFLYGRPMPVEELPAHILANFSQTALASLSSAPSGTGEEPSKRRA